ncbi:hypothetical protein MKW94_030831 [Papaver nudicaule]|uniref:Uncharacterized protein n=1 Tax=Papaver nudicaule TaxID=74823 RepID=A0AA41V5W0_PAPNU|nr:hypothetical protein [Papaver nudicaule]
MAKGFVNMFYTIFVFVLVITLSLKAETTVGARVLLGVIDGSLNNLHAADRSNVLGALENSKLTDASNNNANTKEIGLENNSINNR